MYWQELTTGIYPWDIHDEGVETILDNLQHEAGCNSAYLVALMHHEKRPLHAPVYPHNPKRKSYIAEDSRGYWNFDSACYEKSRIKPLGSDRAFLQGTDWLQVLVSALKKRGMKAGAEISHTPLDKERARNEFADCIQRDVYGRPCPQTGWREAQQLCWNNPDARDYIEALATDLVKNYEIDFVQTCSLLFHGGVAGVHPLLGVSHGGCFCSHCEREARKSGLDWEKITATVRYFADIVTRANVDAEEHWLLLARGDSTATMLLLDYPELYEWLRFRCDSITRYFEGLSKAVHSVRSDIDLRFNTCWKDAELIGQDLRQIGPLVDSVRMMDYSEQTGDEEKVRNKSRWLANVRRQIGDDKPIIAGIAPRAKATPELIKLGIKTVALGGVEGLSFGFYDGASMANLRAIKQGMEEVEVELRRS